MKRGLTANARQCRIAGADFAKLMDIDSPFRPSPTCFRAQPRSPDDRRQIARENEFQSLLIISPQFIRGFNELWDPEKSSAFPAARPKPSPHRQDTCRQKSPRHLSPVSLSSARPTSSSRPALTYQPDGDLFHNEAHPIHRLDIINLDEKPPQNRKPNLQIVDLQKRHRERKVSFD
jgi:hypothetical protein